MAQYDLSLRDYLRVFRKRKFIVVGSVVVFAILGGFYSPRQVPVYKASATVKIEQRKTVVSLITELITIAPGSMMESQVNIIKGYQVMKKVALRLGYIDENSPIPLVHKAVEDLRSRVTTERIRNTNIIKITATSTNPEAVLDLANTVAQVYVEENLLEKNKQARNVRKFIEQQLSTLTNRLEETEEELRIFGEEVENIEVAEPIHEKLVELEFKLAALVQKYTEKHPKVIQLKQQIKDLKEQIKGFSKEELKYAGLKREVEVNRKLYSMLKENLEQARITEAEKISDASVVDPAITIISPIRPQGSLGVLFGGVMGLILGSILTFIRETLDTSIGTIEDVEKITNLPVLGIVPSIESEIKEKKRFSNRAISKIFPPKKTEEEKKFIRLIVHYKPTSSISESFRNIRTNLKISPSKKLILVTSSNPQEGKTVTLVNLGLVTAQKNLKTLLVSSDLRRPALAKTFGIERVPGLTEVLLGITPLKDALRNIIDVILGKMDFEEVVKPSGLRNIWVLPSGSLPSNPAEVLAVKEMVLLIKQLRQEFDVVFFDSPPVLPVTDASILAPLVDAVILCYEVGKTSRDALLRAKLQLDSANANIQGIILNHTKPQTGPLEPYPYYYKYKKYRYYEKEETAEKTEYI